MYVLATDLDGTFLETPGRERDRLYEFLHDNPNILLVYVTGRSAELVYPLLDDTFIPSPDYVIGDVGATVLHGDKLAPVQPLMHEISARWHKAQKSIADIDCIHSLERQDQPQERRISYYVDPENKPDHMIEKLKDHDDFDMLYSNEIYLDLLPKGVNKGWALTQLMDQLSIAKDRVMVAGDTMNDFSMYEHGFKGVVLSNSEQPLKDAAKDLKNVYFSDAPGTEGILEALQHYDMASAKPESITPVEYGDSDLVMVYHRLPYQEEKDEGEVKRKKHASPNGIIPTLLGFFSEKQKGSWIAWSKCESRTPENFQEHVDVDLEKYENLKACRIPLTSEDVKIFYEVFSKEAFWLLLHSFHERVVFNHEHWDHFLEINEIFAQKAAQEASEGAVVWIHDYNLWMVPAYLRQMRPDVKIAFYHHTPFPSADIFNMIPWRREIINSLMQCDYIGFHIPQYVENFSNVVRSNYRTVVNEEKNAAPYFITYGCAIGADTYVSSLSTDLDTVEMGAHPVGINCEYIKELVNTKRVQDLHQQIKEEIGDKQCIISIERTDYTKGPIEKLQSYQRFLEEHPDVHENVTLIMVCTPPAKGMKIYEEISQDIAYHVGLINGKYGTYNWTPILFVNRMIPFEDVIAYYKAADVGWVTPLRDGLNLVAKEYVMAKHASGIPGALVLSEFAGSATELHGAYLTNPYDVRDMSRTLYSALKASKGDKKSRLLRMANIVQKYNVNVWGQDFLERVKHISDKNENDSVIKVLSDKR
jgi:glucosylglycerol-phosphate synthase